MSLGRWLQEQLFARRILLVTGRLDDASAANAAAGLMALDANADKPIELHLDTADGTLAAAFVLIDTLDLLRARLRVQCCGHALQPGLGPVALGCGARYYPHTWAPVEPRRPSFPVDRIPGSFLARKSRMRAAISGPWL